MNDPAWSGRPVQVVLKTADVPQAQAFYTELLGWGHEASGFTSGGHSVAHVESGEGGWLPFVAYPDLDEAAKNVGAAGGTISDPARHDDLHGRRMVIEDPTGAPLGLWQIDSSPEIETTGELGGIVWIEEKTRNRDAASQFLTELFGFEFFGPEIRGVARPFRGSGPLWGGVMEFDDRWTPDHPPHWLVYVWVDAVEPTVVRAVELGGSIWFDPVDTPLGRLAYLRDPEGNAFAVVTVSERGLGMIRS